MARLGVGRVLQVIAALALRAGLAPDRPNVGLRSRHPHRVIAHGPGLVRGMVTTFAEALMGAEVDAICGFVSDCSRHGVQP
jgi:hypothetical protein